MDQNAENKLFQTLGAIQESVENTSEDVKQIDAKLTKQNGRVGSLERWRAYIVGIVAGIGFIIGAIVKWG